MKRLLFHGDGRLRTGVVSVLTFLLLLGLAEAVFEVKTRSEQKLVKVRHVFEETTPEVVVPEKVQPELEAPEPESEPVVEPEPEPEPKPVPVEDIPVPPEPVAQEDVSEPVEPEIEPAVQENIPVAPVVEEPPSSPPIAENKAPQPEQEAASGEPKQNKVEANPLLALLGEKEVVPDTTGQREFEISDELRALAASPVTAESAPDTAGADELFQASIPRDESEVKKDTSDVEVVSDTEVRLPSAEYNDIFKSWRQAGSEDQGKEQLSFRVQDLRQNYQLLQMKPVVVRNQRYQDLFDGSPLPDEVLQEYSTLQLVVEQPWQEWGAALKGLGLRPGDDFSIRYLLYGSIDRAMQNRVNRAFECGRELGLLPPDTTADKVEVVGRVIQISRDGGGRFGVFIPHTLRTEGAPLQSVPGRCFKGNRDVEMLIQAGVVKE